MKRTNLFHLLSITVLVCAASFAQAANWYVATTGSDSNPGTQALPFRTIGIGIASAASGDTVLVADGTYNEHTLSFSKNLVLRSQSNNPAACVLDCQQQGQALFIGDITGGHPVATVSGLTIRNARYHFPTTGAGIHIYDRANVSVTNCHFTGNKFDNPGYAGADALYVSGGGHATVTGCTFSGNGRSSYGVVVVGGGSAALSNCTFANNSTSALGQTGGTCTVTRCMFTGNQGYFGGGIYAFSGATQVSACTFQGNGSINISSTVSTTYGNVTLSSCLIQSGTNLAAEIYQGTISLINCSLVGTRASVQVESGGVLNVANSIIWGSDAAQSGISVQSGGTATVTHSDIQGGFAGTGNLNADPNFVNPTGGNYRLQSTSPCLNTGSAAAPNLPTTDLDGGPRIIGSAPDMGAYELWQPASGTWWVDKALGNDTTGNGSPTAPYKTVVKAINSASNGHSIYIKAGNYGTDRPRITKSLRLLNWLDTGLSRIGQP